MTKLRLVFMGTPDFSVPALHALANAGHAIAAVYCQPPKPAGRGQSVRKNPVHIAAEAMGIEVRTPKTLRDPDKQKKFADLGLDVAVVVAYGLILPSPILEAPKYGCLNIHASLLPRWRGAAPIQRAIEHGDSETGITIMKMDAGLDTGPMLLKETMPITASTTAGLLHDTLSGMGGRLITRALDDLSAGQLHPEPQSDTGTTYAKKLTREEGRIEWSRPAIELERRIRAFDPWPGTFFVLGNEPVKILAAEIITEQAGSPGTLLDEDFTVACGAQALRLLKVQRGGKNPTDGASFLRGARLTSGQLI